MGIEARALAKDHGKANRNRIVRKIVETAFGHSFLLILTKTHSSCLFNFRSKEHDYENLNMLNRSNEEPSEYIDMLYSEQGDESEKLFQSAQCDIVL